MNQNDETLELLLKKHGLTQCPHCHTPMTTVNVGWNPAADYADVSPIVYIACKQCNKRLKVFDVKQFGFAQSLEEALQALKKLY